MDHNPKNVAFTDRRERARVRARSLSAEHATRTTPAPRVAATARGSNMYSATLCAMATWQFSRAASGAKMVGGVGLV